MDKPNGRVIPVLQTRVTRALLHGTMAEQLLCFSQGGVMITQTLLLCQQGYTTLLINKNDWFNIFSLVLDTEQFLSRSA